ncbi:hypothetical protein BJV78DRAFT_1262341 [Lactifluus subvellereus]|nr:hypothetical protein BJV78DRAFT_1262341 [Lactifluus subvellereus]
MYCNTKDRGRHLRSKGGVRMGSLLLWGLFLNIFVFAEGCYHTVPVPRGRNPVWSRSATLVRFNGLELCAFLLP